MGVCSSVDEKAGDTTAGLSPSEIDVKRAMSIVGSAPSGKTMCKLRSRSDASLEDLLTQPVVKKAFQTFLTPLDADRLLMFWVGLEIHGGEGESLNRQRASGAISHESVRYCAQAHPLSSTRYALRLRFTHRIVTQR